MLFVCDLFYLECFPVANPHDNVLLLPWQEDEHVMIARRCTVAYYFPIGGEYLYLFFLFASFHNQHVGISPYFDRWVDGLLDGRCIFTLFHDVYAICGEDFPVGILASVGDNEGGLRITFEWGQWGMVFSCFRKDHFWWNRA